MSYRNTTTASSEYGDLTPDKAVDGFYSFQRHQCFSSSHSNNISAWWEVTFQSISKIFKINLVFRDTVVRHAGYYLFITNQTVNASDLIHLDPVYHDEEPSPSLQNTIIFPAGHSGVQVYLYINQSNQENVVIIEPCEVEIYGCVEGDVNESYACVNTTIGGQGPDLWQTSVAFRNGSLALTCDDYYLSIMNMSDFNVSEILPILEACDGKQHCSFKSSSNIQHKTLMFYCQNKCSNENYTNSHLNCTVVEDLGIKYQPAVSDSFTAFLKSRVYDCCKCPCDRVKTQYFITDTEVLRKKINKLNNELKVHRKDLSATVRAKTCAKDERKSSKYLGFITGIGITTAVLVIIVCSDLPLMYRQVRFGPYASQAILFGGGGSVEVRGCYFYHCKLDLITIRRNLFMNVDARPNHARSVQDFRVESRQSASRPTHHTACVPQQPRGGFQARQNHAYVVASKRGVVENQ
ncbi:uncharacterized protein LOC130047228 [Ostrea edulis]|uniref:uncharacterized protein LOC130047228 n=1 Tax=Ostrea edulis TaxID=37623 RepID=UPI0024AF5E50|nr:uncharacterized protein LOC130047228 [Ostrea edulis]